MRAGVKARVKGNPLKDERTQGCQVSVDDSALALEQGGLSPSPPGSLHVDGTEGVGVELPCPPVQSRRRADPTGYLDYTANLDAYPDHVPFYQPIRCTPKYIVLQCACGRRIVPSTCMSLDCEICKPHVGKRRADSIYHRILGDQLYQRSKWQRKAVLMTIFTVPPEVRGKYLDPKAWQKVRKQAWQILRDHFGALYGVEASHPAGDKATSLFHPHLNFLWVQRKGWSPFVDVSSLRHQWSVQLGVDTVDVYHRYTRDVGKIIHWARYVSRTFPGTHKWAGPIRWYGKYPKVKRPQNVVCWDCGSKFKLIGWVDVAEVQQWEKTGFLMGRAPPWEDDSKILHVGNKRRSNSEHTSKAVDVRYEDVG